MGNTDFCTKFTALQDWSLMFCRLNQAFKRYSSSKFDVDRF